jgi:hypothetical protein
MKVFRDDKVYVQIKDLAILFKSGGVLIPQSVFKKALKKALDMTDKTKDEFVMFDSPEEINLFKNVDYIVDLDDIINMTPEEYESCLSSSHDKVLYMKSQVKEVKGYFQLLGLNDKYRKEIHKIKGVREARFTKTKNIEAKLGLREQKKLRLPFFNRRGN